MSVPQTAPDHRSPAGTPQHPRNPWFGFLYAAILLTGAAAGSVMFALGWREAVAFEMYGQRSEGFVLTAPVLSAAGGVLMLVRAILAVAPWVRYRSTVPRDRRLLALAHDRSNSTMPIVMALFFGVSALGGFVLLAGLARPSDVFGAAVLLQLEALLLFVAILCLKGGIQAIWANRHLAARTAG